MDYLLSIYGLYSVSIYCLFPVNVLSIYCIDSLLLSSFPPLLIPSSPPPLLVGGACPDGELRAEEGGGAESPAGADGAFGPPHPAALPSRSWPTVRSDCLL